MSKISELKKKRQAIEAELPERKLQDLDAEIAAAKAEEQAAQDREHALLVAEARAGVTAAMVPVRHETERLAEALQLLDVAIAKVHSLGEHETGAKVNLELRAAVRAQIGAWVTAEEAARKAAISPEQARRAFLEGRLVFEQELLGNARKSNRDEDAYRLEKSIAAIREELGLPTPVGERVRQLVNPRRASAETADQTAMEHHDHYAAQAAALRAKGL
jgi:hypothetical protein